MGFLIKQILASSVVILMFGMCFGHEAHHSLSGSCASGVHQPPPHHKHVFHDDHNHYEDHRHHHQHHGHDLHHHEEGKTGLKLPEELAEEEDLKLYGLGFHHGHDRDADREFEYECELYGVGLWVRAIGCSLLYKENRPRQLLIHWLFFGAGAMLGDAFLHQLPHAFGGENSNSHDHNGQHVHHHLHIETVHSHSHSLKDLSVGLSILAGIVVFLLVVRAVRYVEGASGGANAWGHTHHHHHHKKDKDEHGNLQPLSLDTENKSSSQMSSKEKIMDEASGVSLNGVKQTPDEPHLQKRNVNTGRNDNHGLDASNVSTDDSKSLSEKEPAHSSSNLVFGYLNLFSDGIHNSTDGMALRSAFLLYGSVGGWSRALFLLAHEIPREHWWHWLELHWACS